MGNIVTDLRVQHVLTAGGILNSLRRAPAQTLGMLQALETDENAARAMQHEQKKAVQWEPWQSPLKTATTTVKIANPLTPMPWGHCLPSRNKPQGRAHQRVMQKVMKKANRQKQHHQPPENASGNLSLKKRRQRNLRRMKLKMRKRKMTVMPAMKASPKQFQPRE